jgi:hypothetical protein
MRMTFLSFSCAVPGDWSRPDCRGRVLCSVEEPGVITGQSSAYSVWERVVLVVGREHVCGYVATDWSHWPRRAYSFVLRLALGLAIEDAQMSLQIFTAHVNFLKTLNTRAAPHRFHISEIGLPLDSLRINNVTYSSNHFVF